MLFVSPSSDTRKKRADRSNGNRVGTNIKISHDILKYLQKIAVYIVMLIKLKFDFEIDRCYSKLHQDGCLAFHK